MTKQEPGCPGPRRRPAGSRRNPADQRRGTLHPGCPLSLPTDACQSVAAFARTQGASTRALANAATCLCYELMIYPREPSTEARLPHRQKPHCEAPTGVADPITTWSSELQASTQEGG